MFWLVLSAIVKGWISAGSRYNIFMKITAKARIGTIFWALPESRSLQINKVSVIIAYSDLIVKLPVLFWKKTKIVKKDLCQAWKIVQKDVLSEHKLSTKIINGCCILNFFKKPTTAHCIESNSIFSLQIISNDCWNNLTQPENLTDW